MDALTRKPWSKPLVTPHSAGSNNIFGMGRLGPYRSEIDGVAIEDLVERYGSPLFVLSERRLRENARNLLRSFKSRYPRVRYGWAYKTHYLNACLRQLHPEGAL